MSSGSLEKLHVLFPSEIDNEGKFVGYRKELGWIEIGDHRLGIESREVFLSNDWNLS
jgi:hypothetical protein